MNTDLFINGEFINTREKQKIINPATREVLAEVSLASEKEIELAIASCRDAFDNGDWPKISAAQRKNFILKIAAEILDKAAELARLETLNTGKPIKESTFMDIPSSSRSFEYIANNFQRYLEEEAIELVGIAQCKLRRQPQGVVLLIVPWNYPLLIASWKLASALAAGNTVILKPSSLTPLTALALGKIVRDSGLPRGAVNVINASGEKVGPRLCADKRIDMISFTGSNAVGKQIIEHSAPCIKKLIMELGGKSASIVLNDADLELAVNGSLCSAFLNQGQMCTATSRILVEADTYDKFLEDFVQKAKRIKLGSGLDYETQMGPLISESQRKRVMAYIEKARKEGAKIACGGKIPQQPDLKNGFFLEPTVLTGVSPQMSVFREEIFGPVVCVNKFSNFGEAVDLANSTDFGLAGCIWTRNLALAEDLAQKINAGTVWINTYGMFYNEAPYGGFKQSGFGKELGKEGFLEYARLQNVVIDQSPNSKPLVNYWYG